MVALTRLTDRGAVLQAMAEFDRLGRDQFLEKYGFREASRYFIVEGGRQYDTKPIFAAAFARQHGTVLTAADFSGGRAAAAGRLERLGFTILRPPALPDWTRDELILALDLYFRLDERIGAGSDSVVALSDELRSLPVFSEAVRSNPRFRNPAGVAMKLSNFQSVDPGYTGRGMRHVSSADREVFEEFAVDRTGLVSLAEAIRAAATELERESSVPEEPEIEAREGRLLYSLHRKRERDARLAAQKKAQVLASLGFLACEVCGFDGSQVYGSGVEVLDVHHIVPLSVIGESTTRLADLAVVCPNCHRAIHQHDPFISPPELRAIVRSRATVARLDAERPTI